MVETYAETTTPMLDKMQFPPSRKLHQYLAAISVSIGAFCAGTVLSWTSPALTHILLPPGNQTNFSTPLPNSPGFTITENEGAFVGSILTIGALFSAIPSGYLADKFGRKIVLLGLALAFLINWLILSFSSNLTMVLIGRFFAGIGLGGVCVVAPMYVGEIAETSTRGVLASLFQLFLASGVLFCCVMGSLINWVGLALVLAIAPVLFGGSFIFMPETPVYLVARNNVKQAEANLRKLRGSMYDIKVELRDIEKELMERKQVKASLSDVMLNRANLKALISVVGVLAFQQLTGISIMVFYTVKIFDASGSNISPFLAAIITNFMQVVVSYVSILVIEKANRKFFLNLSSVGMMLGMVAMGMFFHLKMLEVDTSHLSLIPLGSLMLFMVSFCIGYGAVPWMLLAELFAPEIKGIASGIGVLTNWGCAFIVTMAFPLMNSSFGIHFSFYTLGLMSALATIFVHFVVPETRGKTLAEIQEELHR